MKNTIKYMAICAAALLGVACIDKGFDKPTGDFGTLAIPSVGVTGDVREKGHLSTRSGDDEVSVDEFDVLIMSETYGTTEYDGKYSALPETMELPVGDYTLYVESHEAAHADWDNIHYSVSHPFTITKGETNDLGELVCKVTNILVSVKFHPDMRVKMSGDCKVEVSIGHGTLEYTKQSEDDGKVGTFKDAAEDGKNTLTWNFTGTVSEQYCDNTGIVQNVKAGEHRVLTFNTEVIERGDGLFDVDVSADVTVYNVNLGVTVDEEEVDVPFVLPEIESNYSLTERTAVKLTEASTATPASVTLSTEWGFTNVVLELTTDNATLEQKFSTANIATFDLATAVSITQMMATGILGTMPYGDDVIGETEITLSFDKIIEYVFKPSNNISLPVDALDIKITATDAEGFTKSETLRMKFVDDTIIAPITITGGGFDIDSPMSIPVAEASQAIVRVNIAATEGIAQLLVNIDTNNIGFGDTLADMGIAEGFDLANPGPLWELFDGLVLPYGDGAGDVGGEVNEEKAVLGKTELLFDISAFVPLITIFEQTEDYYANFTITVIDEAGNPEVSKTIQLNFTN